jgi:hypothetical protein
MNCQMPTLISPLPVREWACFMDATKRLQIACSIVRHSVAHTHSHIHRPAAFVACSPIDCCCVCCSKFAVGGRYAYCLLLPTVHRLSRRRTCDRHCSSGVGRALLILPESSKHARPATSSAAVTRIVAASSINRWGRSYTRTAPATASIQRRFIDRHGSGAEVSATASRCFADVIDDLSARAAAGDDALSTGEKQLAST